MWMITSVPGSCRDWLLCPTLHLFQDKLIGFCVFLWPLKLLPSFKTTSCSDYIVPGWNWTSAVSMRSQTKHPTTPITQLMCSNLCNPIHNCSFICHGATGALCHGQDLWYYSWSRFHGNMIYCMLDSCLNICINIVNILCFLHNNTIKCGEVKSSLFRWMSV